MRQWLPQRPNGPVALRCDMPRRRGQVAADRHNRGSPLCRMHRTKVLCLLVDKHVPCCIRSRDRVGFCVDGAMCSGILPHRFKHRVQQCNGCVRVWLRSLRSRLLLPWRLRRSDRLSRWLRHQHGHERRSQHLHRVCCWHFCCSLDRCRMLDVCRWLAYGHGHEPWCHHMQSLCCWHLLYSLDGRIMRHV